MAKNAQPATGSQQKDNRRHHKVPVALLGRFTEVGTDDGVLHVLDAVKGRWRRSTPQSECREHGYYAVDADGWKPGEVEDLLATEIEGPAGPVLKSLAKTHGQPSVVEMGALVRLLGMQLLRVDNFRAAAAAYDRSMAERLIREMSTEAAFDEFERKHGVEFSAKTREGLRKVRFALVGNTRAVDVMLRSFGHMQEDLARLHWRVATLPLGRPDLVCSDCPANFVQAWEDGALQRVMGGWSLPTVAAMMPLSPRQLLIGTTEALEPLLNLKIESGAVAQFNHVTVTPARWVYASEPHAAGIAARVLGR